MRLRLALGGVVIEIRSNSAPLIEELSSYFGAFLTWHDEPHIVITALEQAEFAPPFPLIIKTPDPGKTRIKEEYADLVDGRLVRKRLTGMVFLMAADVNLAVGPCLANANQVVNFVNGRYIEHLLRRGGLLCHASACAKGSGAIVIAGGPGVGKSTLALHLLEHGFDFVSNDRVVLLGEPRSVHAHGVPKLPRVNPGTIVGLTQLHALMTEDELEAMRSLPPAELWQLERKFDVPLDSLYGPDRFRLDTDVAGVLILEWTRAGGACHVQEFAPSERPDLLKPLVKSTGLFLLDDSGLAFSAAGLPDPSLYAQLLSGMPAFRLSGGVDFERAIQLCAHLGSSNQQEGEKHGS